MDDGRLTPVDLDRERRDSGQRARLMDPLADLEEVMYEGRRGEHSYRGRLVSEARSGAAPYTSGTGGLGTRRRFHSAESALSDDESNADSFSGRPHTYTPSVASSGRLFAGHYGAGTAIPNHHAVASRGFNIDQAASVDAGAW